LYFSDPENETQQYPSRKAATKFWENFKAKSKRIISVGESTKINRLSSSVFFQSNESNVENSKPVVQPNDNTNQPSKYLEPIATGDISVKINDKAKPLTWQAIYEPADVTVNKPAEISDKNMQPDRTTVVQPTVETSPGVKTRTEEPTKTENLPCGANFQPNKNISEEATTSKVIPKVMKRSNYQVKVSPEYKPLLEFVWNEKRYRKALKDNVKDVCELSGTSEKLIAGPKNKEVSFFVFSGKLGTFTITIVQSPG